MKKLAISYEVVLCQQINDYGDKTENYQLARVALVDENLSCIYDKFVAPSDPVIDYRTPKTGITEDNLRGAPIFSQVQAEVANLISGCLLIGHSIVDICITTFTNYWTVSECETDDVHLRSLGIEHPYDNMRDVSYYRPFRLNSELMRNSIGQIKYQYGNRPSLKDLAWRILKERIPNGNAVEDAKAAMKLYQTVAHKWN